MYYMVYSDEESLSEPDTNEKSLEPIENCTFSAKDIKYQTRILVEHKDESKKHNVQVCRHNNRGH